MTCSRVDPVMSVTIEEAKAALRAEAGRRRRQAAAESPEAGAAVCRQFLEHIVPRPGALVSGYWPIGSALNLRPLLAELHGRGHRLGLPVVVERGLPLLFRAWAPGETLEGAAFGLHEPPAASPEMTPDLLLVPLLAFDRRGYRLGYGGGFYDRTLSRLRRRGPAGPGPGRTDDRPRAVGVAFAAQGLPEVPRHEGDEALDRILTEAEAIEIAPSG